VSRKPEPRRIVFIALAEIGALVLAYPAVALARRRYPEAKLYFLSFTLSSEMLELMGFDGDHQIVINPSSPWTLIRDAFAALIKMRRFRIDTAINFEIYARFSTLLPALAGIRWRVGFHRFHEEGHYLGHLLTHRLVYNPHLHITRAYLSLVSALSESLDGEPRCKEPMSTEPLDRLRIEPLEKEVCDIFDRLRQIRPELSRRDRLVILNANASDLISVRRWPESSYVLLAERLLNHEEMTIVLTGSSSERAHAERLAQQIRSNRVINMAGKTTMRELITLFDVCHLMVTNDSGPSHFASTTQLPTLVMFGPETPKIFGPIAPDQEALYLNLACSPCVSVYNQKRSPCRNNQCLKSISVSQVYLRACEKLGVSPVER